MSEEKETIINGIDVSESVLTATNNDVYYSQKAVDELQNNIKRLQEENEELKKYQYTQEYLQSEIEKRQKALEEIRKAIGKKYGMADIIKIRTILNEVLEDSKDDTTNNKQTNN